MLVGFSCVGLFTDELLDVDCALFGLLFDFHARAFGGSATDDYSLK